MPTPKFYWQRDAQWAGIKLGYPAAAADSTIGKYGCLLCEISQILGTPPNVVNQHLVEQSGYVRSGSNNLINFSAIQSIYPDVFVYSGRIDCPTTPAPLAEVDAVLAANNYCIVYVDASAKEAGLQQHFVTIVGKDSRGYLITDPWYGDLVPLCPRYGTKAEFAICGIVKLAIKHQSAWVDPMTEPK